MEIEGIDTAAGIDNCGDEESYIAVLSVYYETIAERADDIERAYNAEKWEDYRILVHALKSSSRTIGANRLADLSEKLEKAAASKETDLIKAETGQLLEIYRGFTYKLEAAGITASEDWEEEE